MLEYTLLCKLTLSYVCGIKQGIKYHTCQQHFKYDLMMVAVVHEAEQVVW